MNYFNYFRRVWYDIVDSEFLPVTGTSNKSTWDFPRKWLFCFEVINDQNWNFVDLLPNETHDKENEFKILIGSKLFLFFKRLQWK